MPHREREFLRQLRATFQVEATEHLQTMATGLLDLERTSDEAARRTIVDTVFRAAHSLKGAARAVDLRDIEERCQRLEDVFAKCKRNNEPPAQETLDSLHQVLNEIAAQLSAPEGGGPATQASAPDAKPAAAPEPAIAAAPAADGTVRISVAKLDERLLKAEEMLAVKLRLERRATELGALSAQIAEWRREWMARESSARTLRYEVERQNENGGAARPELMRVLDFLDWSVSHDRSVEMLVDALTRSAREDAHLVGRLTSELLADSKELLLLPFSTVSAQLPRVVRDIAREQGKEVRLIIRGDDVEVDKRVLEEIKDPLVHLLRNAVDHGVEAPAARARAGKLAAATVTVTASRVSGSMVEITVADDGSGIDIERLKTAAIERGRITAEEARVMDDESARALVFQPEVSTSPIITRVSGRGLGMAIVRERAVKLRGTVSVESTKGEGTTFRIVVPSVLATFRGVLVEAEGRRFIVPTAHVDRVSRITAADVRTAEGRETITLGGVALSCVRLADVLSLSRAARGAQADASMPVVVIGASDQRIAFVVDAVLDEQEVLVKPLKKPLVRIRHVAGATVLGTGQVVPVLDVGDLLKSARTAGATVSVAAPATAEPAPASAATVLVAEDSITSRMLIAGILESAGYTVRTAADGLEAFTILRAEHVDLVVSDVEMPRLNGFDLTARIRADRQLADVPVVLVTALETAEDRERGIDVGANAYIVKSRFDQSNLLDAVRRLV